jgi:hypothetical protein
MMHVNDEAHVRKFLTSIRIAPDIGPREEIPHVSRRTTKWIDSNVEILFMALVKFI